MPAKNAAIMKARTLMRATLTPIDLRREFVFANRDHRPPQARSLQTKGDDEHERDKHIHPKQVRVFWQAIEADRAADRRRPELR